MRSVRKAFARSALLTLVIALAASAMALAAPMAAGQYKLRWARYVIDLSGGRTKILLTSAVPEPFVVDLLGQPAVDVCKAALADGSTACYCRRGFWVAIDVQKRGGQPIYHYLTWSGEPGDVSVGPEVWMVSGPDAPPHQVPFK